MGAVEAPSNTVKVIVIAIILALIAYADKLASLLQGWDGVFFWVVLALFVALVDYSTSFP